MSRMLLSSSPPTKHLRPQTKRFTCSYQGCSKSFNKPDHLRTHIRTHTGERPFQCSVCSRGFAGKGNLKKHYNRIHTGFKPFKCSFGGCDKSFSDSDHLRTHINRTHTGERPFQCSVCSRGFGTRDNLKKHYRIHTGFKPFKCSFGGCDKSFSVSSNLNRHWRTHTGEKPFKCEHCDKSFSHMSSKKKHMAIHVDVTRLSCSRQTGGEKPRHCICCYPLEATAYSLLQKKTFRYPGTPRSWRTCRL